MSAVDMAQFIIAKSDQLNADDLIGGPQTITVTKVSASPDSAEQPVSIHYDGDNGKPFKPCKSMRRVLASVWGRDGSAYVGRSMTVYRDDKVMFGGIQVGGIRISHMSHIDQDTTTAIMITRGKRAPYKVKPLPTTGRTAAPRTAAQTSALSLPDRADAFLQRVLAATTPVKMDSLWAASEALRGELGSEDADLLEEVTTKFDAKRASLEAADEEPA